MQRCKWSFCWARYILTCNFISNKST
jgi:hypothetical protein